MTSPPPNPPFQLGTHFIRVPTSYNDKTESKCNHFPENNNNNKHKKCDRLVNGGSGLDEVADLRLSASKFKVV